MKLFNTLTGKKETLTQRDGMPFTMYFCGPTVYNYAHIGNFRTYLVQDVLVRTLQACGYNTVVVRNITDVDDKTIRDSQKENKSLREFTEKWTQIFHNDCDALNVLRPNFEPKATDHINEQIEMIQSLIDKGFAYVVDDGSVYFDVSAYDEYGHLSRVGERTLISQELDSAGNRNLADEYDRDNIADFALWKSSKPEDGENFWKSPWGNGRPGWHIECSAMAKEYLGATIDLHSGGVDLKFPHHENEIAQSQCANGQQFSRYWMHIAHLLVDGTKMSKKLGNLYTLNDINERGFSALALRYALISAHYTQPLNFTFNNLVASTNALDKLKKYAKRLGIQKIESVVVLKEWQFLQNAFNAITDDLNIPSCLGELFKSMHEIDLPTLNDSDMQNFRNEFSSLMFMLGLYFDNDDNIDIPDHIKDLAAHRWQAKVERNFKEADALRQQIVAEGWGVNDTSDGYSIVRI